MSLVKLLDAGYVLAHPFVIGKLALGRMRERKVILAAFSDLPRAQVATEEEAMSLIERHALCGRGVGYIDVHLLAAARPTPGTALWTTDRRLYAVADALGMAMMPDRSG